jgi:hypothetical protein
MPQGHCSLNICCPECLKHGSSANGDRFGNVITNFVTVTSAARVGNKGPFVNSLQISASPLKRTSVTLSQGILSVEVLDEATSVSYGRHMFNASTPDVVARLRYFKLLLAFHPHGPSDSNVSILAH